MKCNPRNATTLKPLQCLKDNPVFLLLVIEYWFDLLFIVSSEWR